MRFLERNQVHRRGQGHRRSVLEPPGSLRCFEGQRYRLVFSNTTQQRRLTSIGPGIPAQFLPNLFKPFSREDHSITRQQEGLGLGLLVAKGLSRKLGGDLACIRAETKGPNHGTEFEMRIPINVGDAVSRPSTPRPGSPALTTASRISAEKDGLPNLDRDRRDTRKTNSPAPNSLYGLKKADKVRETPSVRTSPASMLTSPSYSSPTLQRTSTSPTTTRRPSIRKATFDRELALKHPLTFLVAEDNKINRSLLVNMLTKLGYSRSSIYEAHDGAEAVRQTSAVWAQGKKIDAILMDLWMPNLDGYGACEKILDMHQMNSPGRLAPIILAVTADATGGAMDRAVQAGMKGFMTKPYKLLDLEKLILQYCTGASSS